MQGSRVILVAALLALYVTGAPKAGWAQELDLPGLAEKTKRSVVHLEILDHGGSQVSSGSGFVVAEGRLVTNEHVISEAASVRAKLADGRTLDVPGVLAADEEKDVAIVQLVGEDLPPPLTLGRSTGLRQGDEVIVIGSPKGLAGTLSTGIISALRSDGLGALDESGETASWAIQTTAAIAPGSSGSPIMTRDGKVVAVAVGVVTGGGNIGFGVPIEEANRLLATLTPHAQPKPFGSSENVERNLIISGLFFVALALAFVLPGWLRRRRERRKRARPTVH
ncbi:MAG: trypsin-like peptidase domain-containing protein [Myxococcales bacterium]|nr:trypsin-like peptidase domain-containing protein [Myxococcales bacterium]